MAYFKCGGPSGEDLLCIERNYDSTATYNTDDTVLYRGELYICLEDGVTGEWNSSKWNRTYLEELSGLNSNLGAKLLWTNSNPKAAFADQTISIDLSDYDAIIIESCPHPTSPTTEIANSVGYSYILKNVVSITACCQSNQTNPSRGHRIVWFDDTGVTIGVGYLIEGTASIYASNNYAIPLAIYGVKGDIIP